MVKEGKGIALARRFCISHACDLSEALGEKVMKSLHKQAYAVIHSSYTLHLSLQRVYVGLAPVLKLHPYELRLESEHIANRHEGEKREKVITKKPLLSLPRALNAPSLHLMLLLKTHKGIFEHCIHQRRFGAHRSEGDPSVEEFLWRYADSRRHSFLLVG